MQIRFVNTSEPGIAEEILTVQCPAYEEEAKVIGFDGIPYLKDTVHSIQSSTETFLGCFEEDTLLGFIAFETEANKAQITRLCVLPSYFRKGVATRLVNHLLTHSIPETPIHVHTGSLNTPALHLYRQFGFVHDHLVEAQSGVWLQCLTRGSP
ncbi:GNAT family N-acetyltransferase [Geomicrobium sp. JSM 1781026]|uniref:GNAT family N-acetyltransferase n=1 Tax=Geomicrobium sp. JSM 1781026 TaxID=3344580 RepID=UPI0035C019D0